MHEVVDTPIGHNMAGRRPLQTGAGYLGENSVSSVSFQPGSWVTTRPARVVARDEHAPAAAGHMDVPVLADGYCVRLSTRAEDQ